MLYEVITPVAVDDPVADLEQTGIDVNSSAPFLLADDFLCTEPGRVTDRTFNSGETSITPTTAPTKVPMILPQYSYNFV